MTAKIAIGWTRTANVDNVRPSELTTTLAENGPITIPTYEHNDRLAFWYADTLGDLQDIRMARGFSSELNLISRAADLTVGGVPGKVRLSVSQRNAALLSGEEYEYFFTESEEGE